MRAIFYKYNKKTNSTARPNNSTTKIELDNVQIKTPSSINQPLIQLAKGTDVTGYNYVYLPSFNRYYFINDITYNIGIWLVSCVVDVLASFREDILNSEQYILRSASDYNGNILDMLYGTEASSNYYNVTSASTVVDPDNQISFPNYYNANYTDGVFIIGVISNNNSGVTYYQLSYIGFKNLINYLMSYVPSDMSDVSNGIAKSLLDPLQYITTCLWYPVSMTRGIVPVINSINIGGYDISVIGLGGGVIETRQVHFRSTISIPKHPQANEYPYTQLEPFSRYNLFFEPFGNIPLDSTKLYGASSLSLDWYLDVPTGEAELFINNGTLLVSNVSSLVGVQIRLSQLVNDIIGGAVNLGSAIAGTIVNAVAGNVMGAVVSGVSGIASTVNSMLPQLSTRGCEGSFLPYGLGAPKLHAFYNKQLNTDKERYGAPLCDIRELDDLSGYVLCSNAVVNYRAHTPLSMESDEVNSLLNTGVYIE